MKTVHNTDGTSTFSAKCRITNKSHSVTIPTFGYHLWQNGMLIQKAMPNVTPDDREFLQSKTSPEGWELLFSARDEE
jgi:hypothetical protein